jgi:hypothetical protein
MDADTKLMISWLVGTRDAGAAWEFMQDLAGRVKVENHCHALAMFFMFYNFARVHQTLRVTPAMEAGIADHVWTVEEIVGLVQEEAVVILR